MEPRAPGGETPSFQQIHEQDPPENDVMPEVETRQTATEQLIQQIKETADKLIRDGANRGDVKLLSTALRELRYCFKIFAAYRNRRKVTMFGSARLPLSHPACQAAVQFGQRMAHAGFMVLTGAASGIMEAGHI